MWHDVRCAMSLSDVRCERCAMVDGPSDVRCAMVDVPSDVRCAMVDARRRVLRCAMYDG